MFFGEPPFESNDPTVSPLLNLLGSGSLCKAEQFFQEHHCTQQMNAEGLIPLTLKELLVKMLAIDPSQRSSLRELLTTDSWTMGSSTGKFMPFRDYCSSMRRIY